MRRRTALAVFLAAPLVAMAPSVVDACGGLVGENGTHPARPHHHAGGVQRRRRALRDGVPVHRARASPSARSCRSLTCRPRSSAVVTGRSSGWRWRSPRRSTRLGRSPRQRSPTPPRWRSSWRPRSTPSTSRCSKGGGDEVGRWALENGFLLSPDAPEVLDFYAARSPVFMAAKFDAQRARELGQGAGDSTPIMATIPTDDPWVPVRILGLGLDGGRRVEADVFLLTDDRPELLAGGPGLTVERSEPASPSLLADLRSDVGHGVGAVETCGSRTSSSTPTPASSTTTSPCRPTRDREPSISDAGVGPAVGRARSGRPAPGRRGGPSPPASSSGSAILAAWTAIARRRTASAVR